MNLIKEQSSYLNKNHVNVFKGFDSKFKFVYVKSNTKYVLAFKDSDVNSKEILRYSLSGVLISTTVDTFSSTGNIRCKGSSKVFMDKNNVVSKHGKSIKLKSLSDYKIKYVHWLPYHNIGVIDTETYEGLGGDGIQKIYSLAFRTNLSKEGRVYYIGKDLDTSRIKLVLEMINELLRPKYDKI